MFKRTGYVINWEDENLVKCPICNGEFQAEPLKIWKFNIWKVSRYACPKCGSRFNVYTNGKRVWTIPKSKNVRSKNEL